MMILFADYIYFPLLFRSSCYNFVFVFLCYPDALDSKFSDESEDAGDEGITGPERTYRGPHITFPLQKKDIEILINLFRKKKVIAKEQSNKRKVMVLI